MRKRLIAAVLVLVALSACSIQRSLNVQPDGTVQCSHTRDLSKNLPALLPLLTSSGNQATATQTSSTAQPVVDTAQILLESALKSGTSLAGGEGADTLKQVLGAAVMATIVQAMAERDARVAEASAIKAAAEACGRFLGDSP